MKTANFDYNLPLEYIAQNPVEPRDSSRLMVIERKTGEITAHSIFSKLTNYLNTGDLLVLNRTLVLPARLHGRKMTGGRVEILLLQRVQECVWECLVGGKRLVSGIKIALMDRITAEIIDERSGSKRIVRFSKPLEGYLSQIGQVPLPPYIKTKLPDENRYQTVYAEDREILLE